MLARRRALGFPTWLLLGPKPQAPGTSTAGAHSTQAQTSLPDGQKAGRRPGAGVSPQTKGTAHVWVPPWQGSKEAVGPAARFTQPASRGPTVTPRLPHPWPHVCVARQPPCHAFSLFCRARAGWEPGPRAKSQAFLEAAGGWGLALSSRTHFLPYLK